MWSSTALTLLPSSRNSGTVGKAPLQNGDLLQCVSLLILVMLHQEGKRQRSDNELALICISSPLWTKDVCILKNLSNKSQSLNHLVMLTQEFLHGVDKTKIKSENRQIRLQSVFIHSRLSQKKQLVLFQILHFYSLSESILHLKLLWISLTTQLYSHFFNCRALNLRQHFISVDG